VTFDRAFFLKNLFPIINVILCGGFSIITLVYAPGDPVMTRLISVVAAMIGFLSAGQIARSSEFGEEKKILEGVGAKIDRLLYLKGDLHLAKNPKVGAGADEYLLVWGSFSGAYRAYNPAYRVERAAGMAENRQRLFEQVFIPRYQQKDACAYYLFMTKDGDENLQYFKTLMQDLDGYCRRKKVEIPDLQSKIKVRKLGHKPALSHPEMYIGTQHEKPTVVYELREPQAEHGNPTYYGVVCNPSFYEVCTKEFDREWEEAGTGGDVDIWS